MVPGSTVMDYLRLAPLELAMDVGELLLQGEVARAILRTLAQHKRLDDAAERLGRQLLVGHEDGFLIAHRYVQ